MNFNGGDWVAVVAAAIAAVSLWFAKQSTKAAVDSAKAAKTSASAAERSATADEVTTQLAKGLSRTCHTRWEFDNRGQMYTATGNGGFQEDEHGTVRMTNTGEEVALNVHATGDIHEHEPVAKVQPGESFTFHYDVSPDDGKGVYIEWDRPEEFRDERMRVWRGFF